MRLRWKLQNLNSAMNRVIAFLILLVPAISTVCAQYNNTYSLEWGGGSWFEVNSIYGTISPSNFAILQLGANKMRESDWRITARVRRVERKLANENTREPYDFPVNMLSLRCVSKSGSSNIPPGNIQNMYIWNPLVGVNNEVELVNFTSLNQEGYHQLLLSFELKVEGGDYLKYLPRWSIYYFAMEYKLYTRNGRNNPWKEERILSLEPDLFCFSVNIDGYPQNPEYSISVLPEAVLEFSTISDYANGTTKTYDKGLRISATSGYEVSVRALSDNFTSVSAFGTIPLNLVSLQLSGGNGVKQPVPLSTQRQMILEGVSTNGEILDYDLIYSAAAIDERYLLINTEQSYSTQLMFEITSR